jgi:hypothetical protein
VESIRHRYLPQQLSCCGGHLPFSFASSHKNHNQPNQSIVTTQISTLIFTMGSKQSSFADKKNKPSAKAAGKALSGERGRKTENSPERPRGVSGSVGVVNSTTFNPILSDTTTMKVAVVDDTPTLILNESNMDSDSEEEEKDQGEFTEEKDTKRRGLPPYSGFATST